MGKLGLAFGSNTTGGTGTKQALNASGKKYGARCDCRSSKAGAGKCGNHCRTARSVFRGPGRDQSALQPLGTTRHAISFRCPGDRDHAAGRSRTSLLVGENAIVESRDGRKQQVGYAIRALTPQENTVRADFWVSSKPSAGWWFLNRMGITLLGGGGRSPVGEQDSVQRLIALLRAVLLTSATTWDCDWAAVAPGDFRWEGEHPVNVPLARYESGWMVYLDPSLAVRLGQFKRHRRRENGRRSGPADGSLGCGVSSAQPDSSGSCAAYPSGARSAQQGARRADQWVMCVCPRTARGTNNDISFTGTGNDLVHQNPDRQPGRDRVPHRPHGEGARLSRGRGLQRPPAL
jgi:hypothetical protein